MFSLHAVIWPVFTLLFYFILFFIIHLISYRAVLRERVTVAKWVSIVICLIGCGLVTFGLLSSLELGTQTESSSLEAMDALYNSSHLTPSVTMVMFRNAQGVAVTSQNITVPSTETPTVTHRLSSSTQEVIIGFAVCFLSGLIQSMTVTLTKLLKDEVDHFMILTFYFVWSGLVISVTLMLIFEFHKLTFPTDLLNISYVAGNTFLTGASAVWYFVALNYGSAIVISIAFNVEIPMRLLFQYVLASHLQPVEGSVWDICGAIVVTIGIALPAVTQLIKSRMESGRDPETGGDVEKTIKNSNMAGSRGFTEEETEKCLDKTHPANGGTNHLKDANDNSIPTVYIKDEAPIYR